MQTEIKTDKSTSNFKFWTGKGKTLLLYRVCEQYFKIKNLKFIICKISKFYYSNLE